MEIQQNKTHSINQEDLHLDNNGSISRVSLKRSHPTISTTKAKLQKLANKISSKLQLKVKKATRKKTILEITSETELYVTEDLESQSETPLSKSLNEDFKKLKNILIINSENISEKPIFKPSILYGFESTIEDTPYFKDLLQNYLLHVLQSKSTIQRLTQIPQELIDSKKIFLPPTTSKVTY